MKTDSDETANLVNTNPTKLAELQKIMNDWRKKVDAQLPTSNPNYDPVQSDMPTFKRTKVGGCQVGFAILPSVIIRICNPLYIHRFWQE